MAAGTEMRGGVGEPERCTNGILLELKEYFRVSFCDSSRLLWE